MLYVVSVFGSSGKKVLVQFLGTRLVSGDYDRKKKRYSRLSVGYTVLAITTGKKNLSGEKKKIQLSVKKKVPAVQFVLVQLELKLIQIR